jgi:hypothetical protein
VAVVRSRASARLFDSAHSFAAPSKKRPDVIRVRASPERSAEEWFLVVAVDSCDYLAVWTGVVTVHRYHASAFTAHCYGSYQLRV